MATITSTEAGPSNGEITVKACVLKAAKDLQLEDRTLPPPGPDELQVAVRATGLCGSDLHYYRHFANGNIMMREPMALGHESAGVVLAVGPSSSSSSSSSSFRVGDRVALEVGVPCGGCARCAEGRYNICGGMRFRSSAKSFPHFQGTLQAALNHPAALCHALPAHVPLALGALVEPLGVAIHAARRTGWPDLAGRRVAVVGAGAVGVLMAAVARIKGARDVVIADIDAGRVAFAVENGFATAGYVVELTGTEGLEQELDRAREVAAALRGQRDGEGKEVGEFDAVFECTGATASVRTGIYACRPGGKLMLIGMGTPMHLLPISDAALREVDILGVFRYANTYPEGIEMVSRKDERTPDFSKLITHRVQGLENAEKAFEMAGKTKDENGGLVLKVMLETED